MLRKVKLATAAGLFVPDRSWARRARGGGRKRPELLSADFSGERERPSSPSPLTENKSILLNTDEEETKPRYLLILTRNQFLGTVMLIGSYLGIIKPLKI